MPDRSLIEQNRALEQKLTQLTREVRTLRIRAAYSGAPRVAEASDVTIAAFDTWVTLVELEVEPGKWLLQVQSQFVIHDFVGTERPRLQIVTRDAGAAATTDEIQNTARASFDTTPNASALADWEGPLSTSKLINVANRSTAFVRADVGSWTGQTVGDVEWAHVILIATPL